MRYRNITNYLYFLVSWIVWTLLDVDCTLIEQEYEVASGLEGSAIWIEICVSQWVVDGKSSVISIPGVTVDHIDKRRIRTAQPPATVQSFETRIGRIETYIQFPFKCDSFDFNSIKWFE